MKILKLSDNTFEKILRIDKITKRILKITYPNKYHNKRLLKLEKIKANLLLRAFY